MPRGHRYIHLDDLKCVKKMQKVQQKIEIYCISNSIFGWLLLVIFASSGNKDKSTQN